MHEFYYALRGAGVLYSDIFLLSDNDVVVVGMFSSWEHGRIAVLHVEKPGLGIGN